MAIYGWYVFFCVAAGLQAGITIGRFEDRDWSGVLGYGALTVLMVICARHTWRELTGRQDER